MRGFVRFRAVFLAMARKWYLESRKPAEKVGRAKAIRMLNYAG